MVRELASGGMGVVYLGRDPVLEREVAIKLLPPDHATAVAIERFILESRILAKLTHPHIVPVLDARHADRLLWFVMPYLGDDTLATRLRDGPLRPAVVRRLGLDLLDALDHAHRSGVVHRDIKPGNIFLQGHHALLADFGVAALRTSEDDTLTGTGELVGTLRYMAPEQRTGDDATERSDIYAVGATLYEAATGRRWDSALSNERRTWRSLPANLRPAVQRALQADPSRRWNSALAFREALRAGARNRTLWLATPAVAALGLAMFAVRPHLVRGAAAAPAPRDGLAVLRFTGAADSIVNDLTQRTILPLEWFPPIRVMPLPSVDTASVHGAIGHAEYVATGTIRLTGNGDGFADITVRDSAGRMHDQFTVSGTVGNRERWGRSIAERLIATVLPGDAVGEFQQLGGVCHSIDAVNDYFDGESRFQREDWPGAELRFQRAQARDSTCLPAAWGEVLARRWQGKKTDVQLAALEARADALPGPLRAVVGIQLDLDLQRRVARYDSLVASSPHFAPGRQLRANELFSRGALVGIPLRTGIAALQDAVAALRGADQIDMYTHIVWGAVRIGDHALAQSQYELRRRLAPPGDKWGPLLRLAIAGRFGSWMNVPMREFFLLTADRSTYADLADVVRFGLEFDDPFDQDAISRALERHAPTPAARAAALIGQATAMLLEGRPLAALERLDRASAATPDDRELRMQGAEWRLLLPMVGVATPVDQQQAARAQLAAIDDSGSFGARAHWVLAVDGIARGDTAANGRHQAALRALAPHNPTADELASYARALTLGARGAFDSALAASDRIHMDHTDEAALDRGPLVRALVYLRRGEWQRALNRRDAAEREWIWHENNDLHGRPTERPQEGELDAALSAIARVIRADNSRARGDTATACRFYARARELWRQSEPGFAGWRDRATRGVQNCPR